MVAVASAAPPAPPLATTSGHRRWLVPAAVLFVGAAVAGALALPDEPADRPADALAELTLDEGRPWPADTVLRVGMSRVQQLLDAALDHPSGSYAWLADELRVEVGVIATNTTVNAQARERLDVILNTLMRAADDMAYGETLFDREAGVVLAVEAVDTYARLFEAPGPGF